MRASEVPLFIQGVVGSSATNSGAVIVPMSLAIVVSSTVAGQLISRTGRYKVFGSLGLGVMAFGLYLLSRVDENSTNLTTVRDMVVVGFGLGITFPVYVIAVQNSFEHHVMGIVTATTQFFRQIGGTMGVAIMGSLLAVGVGRTVSSALGDGPGQTLPEEVRIALENPQLLIDSGARADIEASLATVAGGPEAFRQSVEVLRIALADAIGDVFLLSLVFVSVAFAASLFIKELPLKRAAPLGAESRTVEPAGERSPQPGGSQPGV